MGIVERGDVGAEAMRLSRDEFDAVLMHSRSMAAPRTVRDNLYLCYVQWSDSAVVPADLNYAYLALFPKAAAGELQSG